MGVALLLLGLSSLIWPGITQLLLFCTHVTAFLWDCGDVFYAELWL